MASVNTTVGYQNLPAQVISTGTETALLVPAQGLYAGLPSPTLTAGAGLAIGFPPDIAGGIYDGHPFVVSLFGKVTTGGSLTFLPNIYQVSAATLLAGTQATLANDHVVVTTTATTVATTTVNFSIQAQFIWDSTSKILGGQVLSAAIKGVNIVANGGTVSTQPATTIVTAVGISDLNFIPSFTFGTANAANSVQVTEFVIDRA
jgi:hypothetical protein